MSEATVIRSPQEFLAAFKELAVKPPALPAAVAQPEPTFAPLSLEQVNAKIEEFSLALEQPLPDPVRAEIERRRALLVTEQFRLRVGYIPDADGNNPAETKALVDAATKSVVASLAAAPESIADPNDEEEEPTEDELEFDLAEQVEVLNAIDEADAAEPLKIPESILAPRVPLQLPPPVTLTSEEVMVLRASLRANLMHVVVKVLSEALQEK